MAMARDPDAASLRGRTFVITGASSGLGRGVALKLAARGANVVLLARREALLGEIADQARAAGGAAIVVPGDVTQVRDMEALAEAALAPTGRIDVWINNAGIGALGRFWDIPPGHHARVVDVNLKGVVYGSYFAVRRFRAQGEGTLVNIGSIDSEVPMAYQGSYSASKAGVLSLGRVLNEELRLDGQERIKVATVMPWAVDTPWWEHAANFTGRAPRMAAMDDPQEVVDAIIDIALDPKEELAVGWKAKASYGTHKLAPDLSERMSADLADRSQMEDALPAPSTDGTLFVAMESGRGVEGGVRERMEREDELRERQGD
ncbi:SDR family NAD(P)-dependent oxidoreductase [Lysobacter sp. GX 14042]|uniref:SDR family NAD(P)-dependent oxidoreductase n=1 Tax=Lysobacter sp. GX 14042 TaxID=2907155 RepID=UPI001F3D7919|nr:SDR family NAD(P)-dependent oxidoreductase [Lysobacter sp. GX 14042]MCE7032561.1 SDR family NAD(P)-dependent oxidoreductase [Lysobacter sp. GX 14042]